MTDNNKKLVGWAVVVIAIIGATFLGVRFPVPDAPPLDEEVAGAGLRQSQFQSVKVNQELEVLGGAKVTGPTAMATATPALFINNTGAGNVSFEVQTNATPLLQVQNGGGIKYGLMFPVGNSASGKRTAFGITSAKVQSATVVPTVSYISTVTAFGCAPDDAAFAGAWDCRAAMGATNNITFTLYEVDATPVPTAAYDEIRYWVVGN